MVSSRFSGSPIWGLKPQFGLPPPTLFPGFPPLEEYFCNQLIHYILHTQVSYGLCKKFDESGRPWWPVVTAIFDRIKSDSSFLLIRGHLEKLFKQNILLFIRCIALKCRLNAILYVILSYSLFLNRIPMSCIRSGGRVYFQGEIDFNCKIMPGKQRNWNQLF